jgi:hypothetical protein
MMCPDDKVAKIKNLCLRSDIVILQILTSDIRNNEYHDLAFNNITLYCADRESWYNSGK